MKFFIIMLLISSPIVILTTYLWRDSVAKEVACIEKGGVYVRGYRDYECVKGIKI